MLYHWKEIKHDSNQTNTQNRPKNIRDFRKKGDGSIAVHDKV